MNEIKTEVSFNIPERTSTISYWTDGIATTTYHYKDGIITMGRRNISHDNSISTYVEGIDELVRWLGKLKALSPPKTVLSDYVLELTFADDVLRHTYYLNQNSGKSKKKKNKLMEACYYVNDSKITFFPRLEIEVSYVDFRMALVHAKNFTTQIKNI